MKKIDYEELALAHDLAHEYAKKIKKHVELTFNYYERAIESDYMLTIYNYRDQDDYYTNEYNSMDDLLDDLKKFTSPAQKHKVGDVVWVLRGFDFVNDKIAKILLNGHYAVELIDGTRNQTHEKYIFPTVEALIDAQVKYWQSLKNEETSTCSENVSMECEHEYTTQSGFACSKCGHNVIKDGGVSECEHEHDYCVYYKRGDEYIHPYPVSDFKIDPKKDIQYYKCKKCGELYR